MGFSGKSITQPAVGEEAKRILSALETGMPIKGPGFEELMKKLSRIRKQSVRSRKNAGKKAHRSL